MEVRCSSCATEYEFDDALVSARGTSVKCTNCGHQFRVHPPASMSQAVQSGALETWVVRDARGKETVYRSLRDLQQAIVKGQLDPKHEMSHAGQPFRALQDIYELSTFFNAARLRPPKPAPRTLLGVGHGHELEGAGTVPPPRPRRAEPTQERITPVAGMPAVKLPAERPPEPAGPSSDVVRTQADSGARPAPRAPSPVPPRPEREASAASPAAAAPWQNMQGLHEADPEELGRSSGAGSRWVALVIVLGGLALVAGTVGRKYLAGFVRPSAEAPQIDQRVPALLEQARVALARGDFDSARAELAKASLLAEADPSVASAKARLELATAEPVWLERQIGLALDAAAAEKTPASAAKAKAAEAEAAAKREIEKKQLDLTFQDRFAKAKAAVEAAEQRAPGALEVVRARVDLLRLEQRSKDARALVAPLSAQASDPDNAYSLGALDVSEGAAGYPAAIDRLRVAARPEEARGMARALLVYVLALSGDGAAASAELDKLQTLAPRHRALPGLRQLVEVASARAAAAQGATAGKRPAPAPPSSAAAAAPRATPAAPPAADLQAQLTHAASLHRQGDLSGAEKVYQRVIAKSPNNITALSGLGDIARQRQANATAAAFYDKVLEQDSNNVQALMARADLYWHAGSREPAVGLYRRALSQVGPSDARGQRALRRIEEFDRGGAAPATEGESSAGSSEVSGEEEEATEGAGADDEERQPSGPAATDPPSTPTKDGSQKPPAAAPGSPPQSPAPSAPAPETPEGEGDTEGDEPADEPTTP